MSPSLLGLAFIKKTKNKNKNKTKTKTKTKQGSEGLIAWQISNRLAGLRDFSLGSERNPLEVKVAVPWRSFWPPPNFGPAENPSPVSETGQRFSAWADQLKNACIKLPSSFQPGLKDEIMQARASIIIVFLAPQ